MLRLLSVICVVVLLSLVSSTNVCVQELPTVVLQILSNPALYGSIWGVVAVSNGTVLVDINSDVFFTPASNNKLLTTSAALTAFGPEFSIDTPILACPNSDPSSLTICLMGQGDATMTSDYVMAIAEMIKKFLEGTSGITSIVLQGDDMAFLGVPSSWEWEDVQADYGAPPSAFVVDENVINVFVRPGSAVGTPVLVNLNVSTSYLNANIQILAVTVAAGTPITQPLTVSYPLEDTTVIIVEGQMAINASTQSFALATLNPTLNFLTILSEFLIPYNITDIRRGVCSASASSESLLRPGERYEGIHISTSSDSASDSASGSAAASASFFSCEEVASLESPSFGQSMEWCLKVSDNLYAELYMRNLGYHIGGDASYATSIATVKSVLETKLGVNGTLFHQMDGSGLSRRNLLTPWALIEVLQAMEQSPNAALFLSFLPVAGVDGTLEDRFVGTPAQGILHAKTGSESEVNALSGWVFPPNFSPVVFSIQSNQAAASASVVRHAIDQIGIALAELIQC